RATICGSLCLLGKSRPSRSATRAVLNSEVFSSAWGSGCVYSRPDEAARKGQRGRLQTKHRTTTNLRPLRSTRTMGAQRAISNAEMTALVLRLTLFGALTYFGMKWIFDAIDPTRKQKIEAQKRVGTRGSKGEGEREAGHESVSDRCLPVSIRFEEVLYETRYRENILNSFVNATSLRKRRRTNLENDGEGNAERILSRIGVKNVSLSEYELSIAAQLVDPRSISVNWNSIAGLDEIVQEIRETVILPIQRKDIFAKSSLIEPPKGRDIYIFFWLGFAASMECCVLLHGPPGCGKTMIAKATAREAGARFINLEVANLTDKWYGESQKLAAAVFTLAVKIQPCIIFIDEIDSFLRSRDSHDHEATAMMKAQFMTLWDGLTTDTKCFVLVMGATNRPQDVDRAILRRMPAMFHIKQPNACQRTDILDLILQNEPLSDEVDTKELAKLTDGFSGSDLKELCRGAALNRVRHLLQHMPPANERADTSAAGSSSEDEVFHDALPPITWDNFTNALKKIRGAKVQCDGTLNHNMM
ncbi:26S proteasome regulatory subunit-like, partial [Tropilaelaps mercedesae]